MAVAVYPFMEVSLMMKTLLQNTLDLAYYQWYAALSVPFKLNFFQGQGSHCK